MALSFQDATKTLVVEAHGGITLEQALQKFQSRRTYKTVLAAQRMVDKVHQVKVPGHALRALWKLTGGWNYKWLSAGELADIRDRKLVLHLGELKVSQAQCRKKAESWSKERYLLEWRGKKVAFWDDTFEPWKDSKRVSALSQFLK